MLKGDVKVGDQKIEMEEDLENNGDQSIGKLLNNDHLINY